MDETNSPIKFAGFWPRLIADLIDSTILDLVVWGLGLTILGIFYWIGVVSGDPSKGVLISFWDVIESFRVQMILVGMRAAVSLPYYTVGHHRFGTTFGKRTLGIYVVSEKGHGPISAKQAWIRTFGYLPSYALMGCGFLMVAFQPEKRALHDLLAGTVSVIRPKKGQ